MQKIIFDELGYLPSARPAGPCSSTCMRTQPFHGRLSVPSQNSIGRDGQDSFGGDTISVTEAIREG